MLELRQVFDDKVRFNPPCPQDLGGPPDIVLKSGNASAFNSAGQEFHVKPCILNASCLSRLAEVFCLSRIWKNASFGLT